MNNEIFEYLSSRSGDAKNTENCRIKEIAHELCRRCRLYEKKSADSFNDVRNHNLFFPPQSSYQPAPNTAGFCCCKNIV